MPSICASESMSVGSDFTAVPTWSPKALISSGVVAQTFPDVVWAGPLSGISIPKV